MLQAPDFLDRLSSADPVPGGGSVAALEVAMAAALVAMVCNLTLGRAKFAGVHDEVREILHSTTALRDRAVALAEEDVRAYGQVSAALALPRATDEERAARRASLQDALKAAAVPPFETMRAAGNVIDLCRRLVGIGNPSAVSDVGTAALTARAGFHAAQLNVDINLASVRDTAWVERFSAEAASLGSPDARVDAIVDQAERIIRGGTG